MPALLSSVAPKFNAYASLLIFINSISLSKLQQNFFLFHFITKFPSIMAQNIKRSGSSRSRRITYVKRRESVLKQAAELSMLYNIDVGLMMFSPTGQFTSFAHKGRLMKNL